MGATVRSDWGYRPHLDGVRTLAVYLVVAFHAGLVRFDGGFIGVDVFFVLSGYLVTSLLLRDVAKVGGVRLRQFYSRRIRRLLPAAVLNLTVTAIVFAAIASPVEAAGAVGAVRAAALYVANWYFIGQSADYFARNITASPVIHYWSLSVEEQFYILWPLLLSGLVLAGRRLAWTRGRLVQIGVVVIGLASLVTALLLARTDPNRAYLATYARAYQLLAGAWLALTPGAIARARRAVGRRVLPWVSVAALLALVGLATSAVHVGPITRGVATTILMLVLLVSLEAADGGIGRRLLSVRPMVYLGRISYGTYLWHWLVIIVLVDAYHPSPLVTFVVAVCIASAIASLSYELLEMPIRTARVLDSARSRVIAVGLVASVLVAAVVAPAALRDDAGRAASIAANTTTGTPNHANWRAAVGDTWNYRNLHGQLCASLTFFKACPITKGSRGSIALVGDSHAGMLVPMFADLARRRDLSLTVVPLLACPWTEGVRYADANPTCVQQQHQVFDTMIPKIDPDIVVLAHRPVDDPTNGVPLRDQELGNLTDPAARERALRRSITTVVDGLRADHRKVVMIEPIPIPPVGDDPLVCLSKATVLEQCRFVAPAGPLPEEKIMRSLAASTDGVWSLDLDRRICPFLPICDPVVDGIVPRLDNNHITVTFGRTLRPAVEQFLDDNGVLPSR